MIMHYVFLAGLLIGIAGAGNALRACQTWSRPLDQFMQERNSARRVGMARARARLAPQPAAFGAAAKAEAEHNETEDRGKTRRDLARRDLASRHMANRHIASQHATSIADRSLPREGGNAI